jgi:hypothetical protein
MEERTMFAYRLKTWLVTIIAFLLAMASLAALAILYNLVLNNRTFGLMGQLNNTPLSLSISAITITAPVFAILDALMTWLRHWRESRTHSELIRVIEAQSSSPKGMDIFALEKACQLPKLILRERVHELVLLGRLGVRTTEHGREYYLVD